MCQSLQNSFENVNSSSSKGRLLEFVCPILIPSFHPSRCMALQEALQLVELLEDALPDLGPAEQEEKLGRYCVCDIGHPE